jgi:hypothetical protein
MFEPKSIFIEFCHQDGWKYFNFQDQSAIYTLFNGKNGSWQCLANVPDNETLFSFFSRLGISVPVDKRNAVAEYLTRANYGLRLGNFELDFGDGEIRYKTSIDVQDGELTTQMVKQMVYANVMTVDKYLPGILSVIYGGSNPSQEIEKIECE